MKITLPFPDYDFALDCGDLPEVRQWLEDNGVLWTNNLSPTIFKTQATYLEIKNKRLAYFPDFNGFLGFNRLPLLTIEKLTSPLLSTEELVAQFLKHYRKFTRTKRKLREYLEAVPDPEESCPMYEINPQKLQVPSEDWEKLLNHFDLRYKTLEYRKLLRIK